MAQIDSKSIDIPHGDDEVYTYTVYPLDPFIANDILVDIVHIVGPSIGAAAALEAQGDEAEAGAAAVMSEAIGGLFQRIDKQKLRSIINTFAQSTEVTNGSGKAPRLNSVIKLHFKGKLGIMYQWLWFAMRSEYQSFFDSAVPAIARLGDLVGAASKSPSTSPNDGSSID